MIDQTHHSPLTTHSESPEWVAALARHAGKIDLIWSGHAGPNRRRPWEGTWSLVEALRGVVQRAEAAARAGQGIEAVASLTALLRSLKAHYGDRDVPSGSFDSVANDALAALREAARTAGRDVAARTSWQAALFALWVTDEYGFLADLEGLLLATAQPEDLAGLRRLAEESVRDLSLQPTNQPTSPLPNVPDYPRQRQRRGRFLLAVVERSGDEGAFVDLCEQYGFDLELALHLLHKGWTKGAVAQAEQSLRRADEIVQFCEALCAAGEEEAARDLALAARSRVAATDPGRPRLQQWLAPFTAEPGAEPPGLAPRPLHFQLLVERFQAEATVDAFQRAVEAAPAAEREALARELMGWLRTQPRYLPSLVHVHLLRGEHADALALLPQLPPADLLTRRAVAEAIKATHPREAMRIYQDFGESFVDQGTRRAYQSAVDYFRLARRIAVAAGLTEEWDRYVAWLHQRHGRRRGLWEEMKRL